MEDKDVNSGTIPNVKIALIGDSGVGKTCIVQRFSKGVFDKNIKTTIGLGFTQKYLTVNNKEIQCNLWDTAGAEKYRSIGRRFYKDAYIICLVYDITDAKSFEDIEKFWIPDLKNYGEECTLLALVGNKSDLYENEKVDETNARKYAEKIKALFFLTSAKSGDNINNLFESLIKKYLDPDFIIKINSLKEKKGESIGLKDGLEDIETKKGFCCK